MAPGGSDSRDERDKLIRLEANFENLEHDVDSLRTDMRAAIHDLRGIVMEIRLAMAKQGNAATIAIQRPMDKLSGVKLALVGIGSIMVFVLTVVGGVLGIVAYFRPPH